MDLSLAVLALVMYGTVSATYNPSHANSTEWPKPYTIPSTNNDIARYWLGQIDFSLVPEAPINSNLSCDPDADPQRFAQATKDCWWSCNLCTRREDITMCPNKGDWGLTFDDGPTPETVELLDHLLVDGTKATFFIIGSEAASHPDILKRIVADGHQIAVHTWSHKALTTLTNEEIVVELGWGREILSQIVGDDVNVTLLRPPSGDLDDRVRAISHQMGLTPVIWTPGFDTNDWRLNNGPEAKSEVEADFEALLSKGRELHTGFVTLEHCNTSPTVKYAIDVVLPKAKEDGWKLQTLEQCGAN